MSQPLSEASYETLAERAHELRARINRFRTSLDRFFVEKTEIIDLMTVCAVAQEPLLLVGPRAPRSRTSCSSSETPSTSAARTTSSTCSPASRSPRR